MPSYFLKEKFFKSIDLNYLRSLYQKKNNQRMQWMSSGSNFQCYRVDLPGKLSLAFKISHENCFKKKSIQDWKEWIHNCNVLSASEVKIFPPMITFLEEDAVIQVLPFGKDIPNRTGQDLIKLQEVARLKLAELNYCLGDIPQFKALDEEIFLVDFSELRPL